jgi:hypothetical protein
MEEAEFGRAGAAPGLAVDGDVLDAQSLLNGLHPVAEAGLKGLWLEPVENPFKGVMRGHAVGQFQEALQPVAAFAAKGFDLLPVLRTGNAGAESDNDDVLQQVQAAVCPLGVFQLAEEPGDRQIESLGVRRGEVAAMILLREPS